MVLDWTAFADPIDSELESPAVANGVVYVSSAATAGCVRLMRRAGPTARGHPRPVPPRGPPPPANAVVSRRVPPVVPVVVAVEGDPEFDGFPRTWRRRNGGPLRGPTAWGVVSLAAQQRNRYFAHACAASHGLRLLGGRLRPCARKGSTTPCETEAGCQRGLASSGPGEINQAERDLPRDSTAWSEQRPAAALSGENTTMSLRRQTTGVPSR